MQIARRTLYGLVTLQALSRVPPGAVVGVPELARRNGLPRAFLQLILIDLRRHGLVDARRGQRGGYRLARPPAAVTVGEVIRALQGPLRVAPALDSKLPGPFAALWRTIEAAVQNVYDDTTLADLPPESAFEPARAPNAQFADYAI